MSVGSNGASSVEPKIAIVRIAVTVAMINNDPTIIAVFLNESILIIPIFEILITIVN
jgi:hypothetical protein